MRKGEQIKQFIYNVIASTLPTVVLQLVILPLVANKMNGDEYGLLLTIIAAVMMIAAGTGNVLNNIHMLFNNEYEEAKEKGDFGVLFLISSTVLMIVTVGLSLFYGVASRIDIILIVVLALLMFTKEYYIVYFWIDLDYLGILICNLFSAMGYVLGLLIFWKIGCWQLIYILGNLFGIVFIIYRYGFPKKIMEKTPLLNKTIKSFLALLVATILTRLLQYVDRLLLYPLLGGEEVTIYYVSTLLGKTISMAIGPINGFLLSQIAKQKTMKKDSFISILKITGLLGIIAYFGCLLISKPVLGILYPQWVDFSMQYVKITTIAAILSAMAMVVSPVVLKFCNMVWQILISGSCFIVYVSTSLLLMKYFGLMGFCFGSVFANLVSLCLMITIYFYSSKKAERLKICAE